VSKRRIWAIVGIAYWGVPLGLLVALYAYLSEAFVHPLGYGLKYYLMLFVPLGALVGIIVGVVLFRMSSFFLKYEV